jgi:hypothetical protein
VTRPVKRLELALAVSSDAPDTGLHTLDVRAAGIAAAEEPQTGEPLLDELLVGFLAFSGDATLDLNGLDLLISQQSPDTVETWISQGRIVNTAADRITISYDSARNCTVIDAAVPEPATMSLLGLGGLAALLRRRRNYHCPPSYR